MHTHPTYTEQIDGLLQEVQHMRLSVVDARQLFLQIVDQAVLETLQDAVRGEIIPEIPKPKEKKLIYSSH